MRRAYHIYEYNDDLEKRADIVVLLNAIGPCPMTALSDVIPGIFVGNSSLQVADCSSGVIPTQRTVQNFGAIAVGATSVALRAATTNFTLPAGAVLSFLNTAANRRVTVQLVNTAPVLLPLSTDVPASISVDCLPVLNPIANLRSAIWFDGLRPVRGLTQFDFQFEPAETDLTGMDIYAGQVTGVNNVGVSATCEFIERPGDYGGGTILQAKDSAIDNIANLWTMFTRSDGALDYGLALFSTVSDPITFNGYAKHSFRVAFQANTYISLKPQVYS